MTAELCIIVPTRSRPHNVAPVLDAWRRTAAFDTAELLFVLDADDPAVDGYVAALSSHVPGVRAHVAPVWRPLVPKLDSAAVRAAEQYPYVGFAGDDHLPRTLGWAERYVETLRGRPGVVFGDDGYRGGELPTQWAMSSSIVTELGRMVPAPVEHLYCDDAIRELAQRAGCLTYLPDVLIEHMHPSAGGKAPMDGQYERVNGREQYRRDQAAYRRWRTGGALRDDAARVKALLKRESGS